MKTLKDYAQEFVATATQTKNICELNKVSTDLEILTKTANKKDGTPFTYLYIIVNGEEYRVPKTVIRELQTALKFDKNLKEFKVVKTGTTKDDTKYSVEPVK